MQYRLGRARSLRRAAPIALAVASTVALAVAVLAGDGARTSATFVAPVPPIATTPAIVHLPSRSTPPPGTIPPAPAPDTTASATTATTSPSSTAPARPLEPAWSLTLAAPATEALAPPAYPRSLGAQTEIGRIAIPALGVDESLLEGLELPTLDVGPGHWPGTAMPGETGNVVVAAHRTSHGGPFRHIDQLVPGDTVEFTTADGDSTYVVTGTQVVVPEAVWIADPTETPTATLFACHPLGSVSHRIVINLELAS